jgi:glutamate/tyrosine decarboxylase-like PLP-dependent enzyme
MRKKQPRSSDRTDPNSVSLDPDDWDALRLVAHRTLDQAIDFLAEARDRPVWRPVPDAVKDALSTPPPAQGRGADAAVSDIVRLVLPYTTGNLHPGFCGWVHGGGTAGSLLAEMLAVAMNANLGGRDHAPIYVERQVVDWFKAIFGFPAEASGLLTSGTSMATVIALAVARNAKSELDVRRRGLAPGARQLTCYASSEVHGSAIKALELLGIGADAMRPVPVDEAYRISVPALRATIEADRAAGFQPFAVIGTAGTVNTGAIDDLAALASVCREQDLWFHVDGAFGALVMLAPELRARIAGIEQADSLAFDFHKWLQVPYDAGCLLVRNEAHHLAAFGGRQSYLAGAERGLAAGNPWYCEFGPELSRGFKALKVWMTVQEHGLETLGAIVSKHCRIAAAAAERISRTPDLELMAPQSLNIVCFRYTVPGMPPERLDALNQRIVEALHLDGVAAPSTARIDGRLAIRACFCNHRTEGADADHLLDSVLRLGVEELAAAAE